MKIHNKLFLTKLTLLSSLMLVGCGGGSSTSSTSSDTNVSKIIFEANAGELLGSQCAQCHGTNGISVNDWDSIAGESDLANEIFVDDEPIMSSQAHGYTSEEIALIGDWLKTLSKNEN